MPRFFVDLPLASGTQLTLPAEVGHHAVRTLRLQSGDALTLFNGQGGEFTATLLHADARRAEVEINAFSTREAEVPYAVTIAQGMSSGDKMDWTVEKAVELGAAAVQPLQMQRSVTRLSGERAERRRQHWQALVQSSCEQCGRNRVPVVHPLLALPQWLASLNGDILRLVLSPDGERSLTDIPRPQPDCPVIVLIGPEGGLNPDEMALATLAGFTAVRIGPRVLRTETAGAAALATLAALWQGI